MISCQYNKSQVVFISIAHLEDMRIIIVHFLLHHFVVDIFYSALLSAGLPYKFSLLHVDFSVELFDDATDTSINGIICLVHVGVLSVEVVIGNFKIF